MKSTLNLTNKDIVLAHKLTGKFFMLPLAKEYALQLMVPIYEIPCMCTILLLLNSILLEKLLGNICSNNGQQ